MKMMKYQLIFLYSLILITGCKTLDKVVPDPDVSLNALIQQNELFQQYFTGFVLQDAETGQTLAAQNERQYFTPASNIKIFTLLATLEILADQIPVFQYKSNGDSLWMRGTGYPAFLHPDLPGDTLLIHFLKSRKEKIFYSDQHFTDHQFGSGWAWDDYYYAFQREKSPLPIYGNIVKFQRRDGGSISVSPDYFEANLNENPQLISTSIYRQEHQNIFEYAKLKLPNTFVLERPFKYHPHLICELLQYRTGITIHTETTNRFKVDEWQTVQQPLNHKLLEMMMNDSDNFVAEQLLLQCGMKLTDTLNTKVAIARIQDSMLHFLSTPVKWIDGSGLSRYNLCTPLQLVETLNYFHKTIPSEQLLSLFPAGGVSGSIKDWYGGQQRPYVFAKTGSMSGVNCLSGYVQTKKGRMLTFSFMHNNYPGSATPFKREMDKVLKWVYLNL